MPIYAKALQTFHDVLEIMHRNQPGHNKIIQRDYRLADEDSNGEIIDENNWTESVKPAMSISLSMLLRKQYFSYGSSRKCPRCSMICKGPELSGQRLRW
jgi:hypothetical protein